MEIAGYSLIVAIISAAFGGGSTLLSLIPFIRSSSIHGSLQKALLSIEATPSSSKAFRQKIEDSKLGNEDHWEHIVLWLDYGEIILGVLRGKVIRRVTLLTVLFLFTGGFIGLDFEGSLFNNERLRAIEIYDFVGYLIIVVTPYIRLLKENLFDDIELTFLQNLNNLHDAFYDRVVIRAMGDFNYEFMNFFTQYGKKYDQELDKIQNQINDLSIKLNDLRRNP